MTPFVAPVDDILFSLRSVADVARISDWDDEMAEGILGHFAQFAEGVIAPLDETGDAQGCQLEDGRVRMPDGFAEAFAQLAEGGWQGLTAPEDFGGMEVDHVVAAAVSEVFSGANHSMQMVCNLVPGAVSTLLAFGSQAQQEQWIPRMSAGEVLSTMCLTEAGAGSDLSRIRTQAKPDAEGWRIEGEKIFISGGDQNLSDEILHLVLARTGPREAGIKGLSLFLCPSHVDGVRNAVTVTRIEEKLGLHASPTCQLAFDKASAELIGDEGAGLLAMFTLMNHARIDVALQGVAHASRAHHIAQTYADERQQGRRADGAPAMLSDHPDVRRMLNEQKSLALGARAMCHLTMVEMELGTRPALVEFLTPICKVFGSEAGIRSADLGIQILGGYGYLTEYGVSRIWRDARITSIYEGANGIHALGISTRGLRWQEGAGADAFDALIGELAEQDADVLALRDAWRDARAVVASTGQPAELAHDFAQLTADLLFRAVWVRIASVADQSADADGLRALASFVRARPLPVRLPLRGQPDFNRQSD